MKMWPFKKEKVITMDEVMREVSEYNYRAMKAHKETIKMNINKDLAEILDWMTENGVDVVAEFGEKFVNDIYEEQSNG